MLSVANEQTEPVHSVVVKLDDCSTDFNTHFHFETNG